MRMGHIALLTQRYVLAVQPRGDTDDPACLVSQAEVLHQFLLEITPSQAPHEKRCFSCLGGN